MKDIKQFFESQVIFKSIITEAKESLPTVSMSVEEWINDIQNDKGTAEVININEVPDKDKYNNPIITKSSTSLLAGYKEIKNEMKTDGKAVLVIPFDNVYIIFSFNYYHNELNRLGVFGVSPKITGIKSVINSSKSAFAVYKSLYVNIDEHMTDKKAVKLIMKELKDTGGDGNFISMVNDKFGAEAQEAMAQAKLPSEDKSPFTLRKKKQFPDYIKHCLLKESDNPIVKKYADWGEAEIFVETVKKDKKNYYKVYMGDVRACFENGTDNYMYTFYLTTLGALDKFLEYALKPNRQKMHSELGADGEIHVWYSSMQKNLPANLKKDCIKDENLIKELNFHDFDLDELYK